MIIYISRVVEGPNASRHWVVAPPEPILQFRGDGPPVDVPLPANGLYPDILITDTGQRVAAVKAADRAGVWLVKDDGTVLSLPDTLGNWAHAFGPNNRLHMQIDASGQLAVFDLQGSRVGSNPMPYDSGSGIYEIRPDGTAIQGESQRGPQVISGIVLGFPELKSGYVAGSASVGVLGGIVLELPSGTQLMWPHYTPHRIRLSVIAGLPYVSICADGAPSPVAVPWVPYDALPPIHVDGSRRARHLVAVSDGVTQGPGSLQWSYTDGKKPHVEGGPWAWRDYFSGRPATIVIHDFVLDGPDPNALQRYPANFTRPPVEQIVREDATGLWVGSIKTLAKLSGATWVGYRDQNGAVTSDGRSPDITDATITYPDVETVAALRAEGLDAWIGHQGYLVTQSYRDATGEHPLSLGAFDAIYRIEEWGLKIYAKAGVPCMLWVPWWTGSNDAYPLYDIAQLHHFTTALVDHYLGVQVTAAFDWTRAGGQQDHPWLRDAWQDFVNTTAPGTGRPVLRGYSVPQPTSPTLPVSVPPTISTKPVSVDLGRHGGGASVKKKHWWQLW